MPRSSSSSAAATAAMPAPDASTDLPQGSTWMDAGNGAAAPAQAAALAQLARYRAEDHDRIARGLTDVVIHRIFAAGLDLQAALGLIGDHACSGKICHAIDELDHAIKDIREIIYDRSPGQPRHLPRPAGSRAGA
jgi:signal transduction histidine kinase